MKGEDIYKKGLWTEEEDRILLDYVKVHGGGRWNRISKITGLKRCGKSCRLRWMNFLNPSVKRGQFTEQEEDLIIRLHNLLGNRWSLIAGRVPGRTDNQVKNHWNTHLCKKLGIKRENRKTALASLNPLSTISNNIMEVGTGVLTRMQTPLTQVSDDQTPPLASRGVHSFCPSNITDHSRERTLTSMEFLEGYSLGDEFWQDL